MWYVALVSLVWKFGLVQGIALQFVGKLSFYGLLYLIFEMERLGNSDEVFIFDDPRQASNNIAFQKIQKKNYDLFRNVIIQKLLAYKRLRSKVVWFLGRAFFKPLKPVDIKSRSKDLIIKHTGVHDEADLAEFMT